VPASTRRGSAGDGGASAGSSSCSEKAGAGPGGCWASSSSFAPVVPPGSGGLGDDGVREPDDLRRRAVVAHEPHLLRAGEAAAELEQVGRRGAGEAVDRLVGVADDAQVVATAEPGVEQPLLQRRDVLVLVDDEGAVARPELLATPACSSSAPR
jgi:hypothetical protein